MRNWENVGREAVGTGGLGQQLGGYLQEGGGSGIGSFIGSMFHGHGPSPYEASQQYAGQIPGQLHDIYSPYMQMGQRQMRPLEEQFRSLMEHPGSRLAEFGKGFQEDPGYQYEVQQATGAANRAAAAGGMLGSPAEQTSLAETINQMANQHYQQYLHNVMGLHAQGIGGTQRLEEQGYGATKAYGRGMTDYLQAQAQAAAASAAAKQKEQQSRSSGIGGVIGGIASLFL